MSESLNDDERWAAAALALVAVATGHSAEALRRPYPRTRPLRQARAMAIYLLHTGMGWPQRRVGEALGLDHRRVGRIAAQVEEGRDDPLVDAILDHLTQSLWAAQYAGGQR